ncbi:MAG: transporter suffix domain-containing protein [Mesobacillus sp.]|uniref:transporter suffix domain-containing protein n=1 Tax=Mesobacillus sp. TaxID=2675271 RepID=UPI003C4D16EB
MQNEPKATKSLIYKVGMVLIISSFIFWVLPMGIPFLPLTGKGKAIGITSTLVIAEVFFWIGAIMVGKEAAGKIRTALNPKNWKRRTAERQNDSE